MDLMENTERRIRAYLHDLPESKRARAKYSLIIFMLTLLRYNQIGDLGIAGVLVFQSEDGKRIISVRKW